MYPTLDTAVYNALVGNDDVKKLVSRDVYALAAPQGVDENYIMFKQIAGGFEHTSPRPEFDVTYRIEGVSTSRQYAEEIASAIYKALHNQHLPVEGWSNYDTAGGGWYTLIDRNDVSLIYRVGGMYRIRGEQGGAE